MQHGQRVKVTGFADVEDGTTAKIVAIYATLTEVPDEGDLVSDGQVMLTLEMDEDGPFGSEIDVPVESTIELLTCGYKVAHVGRVPSTTTIDCGPIGQIEACQDCANLHKRLTK